MPTESAPHTPHPFFAPASPRVLAHRGLVTAEAAEAGVVENSFAAVAGVHAAGADYVESDCHLTSDDEVVLFHDADLTRITGDPRPVSDVTARELDRLMADRGGLVTLSQALEAFPTLRFNLDVKASRAAQPVGRLVAAHGERVLLTSFSDERRLSALRAAAEAGGVRPATSAGSATIARVLTAVTLRSERLIARALTGIDALQIPERQGRLRILSSRLVAAAHRHATEVHVWTVNDADDMRRLVAQGVDGIVTDHADVALATLA